MSRYYLTIWLEDGNLCCEHIVPGPVRDTIKSAVEHGMRHGTVIHQRTIRGVNGEFPELYCWQVK